MILRWLTPAYHATSVVEVDPQHLVREGIRGVVLDLDNTVVAWNAPTPTEAIREWVDQLRRAGLKACIVSNNFRGRPRAIADTLGIPVVLAAVKPTPWALRKAMTIMGTPARQTALIGDQVFTDILGGNLVGMYTILVDPLSSQEFPTTKLVRRLERLVRARVIGRIRAR